MIKLQHSGFKFYPTSDGNEYVTPEKVDSEIIKFVEERGKVSIGIIPQILNLSLELIESRINLVCQKSTIIRNNTILVSAACLKGIVQSIKQRLEIEGVVNLDEVGLENEFNMNFVKKIVADNIEELDAEIASNQLITKEYRRMKKKRILGFLLAFSRPVSIENLLKMSGIEEANPEELVQELIKEGKLRGKCQNSYFIPDKFSENQK